MYVHVKLRLQDQPSCYRKRTKALFCLERLAMSKEPEDFTEEAVSNNYHVNNNIVSVVNVNKRYHCSIRILNFLANNKAY